MKILICLAIFSLSFTALCFSQSKESPSKAYVTSGGELIFSLASIEQNGNSENATLRFSPVVNFQVMVNKDLGKNFGLFGGLALRNVGYIMNDYIDFKQSTVIRKNFGLITSGSPLV